MDQIALSCGAVNTPSVSRAHRAELPSRQRARRTNDPLSGMSMNTARGRRFADLTSSYLKALENPADVRAPSRGYRRSLIRPGDDGCRGSTLSGLYGPF